MHERKVVPFRVRVFHSFHRLKCLPLGFAHRRSYSCLIIRLKSSLTKHKPYQQRLIPLGMIALYKDTGLKSLLKIHVSMGPGGYLLGASFVYKSFRI